ncbi:hypothetical protein MMC27_007558 [Xylographa pallens]|nr:hypothetical protein [Xylographa pallens]
MLKSSHPNASLSTTPPKDKAPEMNALSNLFKAAKPSETFQVPSESSTDNQGLAWPDVGQRQMVAANIIDMTSEDEKEEYDEDDLASYHEDHIKEELDDDEAPVDVEKITVQITPKNPAKNIWVTPYLTPRRRKNPSPRTAIDVTNLDTDDDGELEGEPGDDDAFMPVDKLTVKLTPRKSAGKLLKPGETPAQPKPPSPPQRRHPSPHSAVDVTNFDTDDDGELEGEPDDDDASIPANKLIVKITPRKPAGKLLKPGEIPAQPKPKNLRVRQAKSDTPSKGPSPPKTSQGTTNTSLSSSRARKKLSPLPRHSPSPSYSALQRARRLAIQASQPRPGPTSLSSNRDGSTRPSSSGSSGTPVTPPIENVLFAERVTRSQTARVREENHRDFGSTSRRAGLTALSFQGRRELPVYQDAYGGPSRRVVYRPEPGSYQGQGIRKDTIGESRRTRRRK